MFKCNLDKILETRLVKTAIKLLYWHVKVKFTRD